MPRWRRCGVAYEFPALAAPFAQALADAEARAAAIENVARSWLRTDPAAAARWLSGTGLPEEQRQRLLAERRE